MKKAVVFCIAVLLVLSCQQKKTENAFSITGNVPESVTGWVYLQEYKNRQYADIDSSEIADGKFFFSGSVSYPEVYIVRSAQKARWAQIFLDNHPITVTLNNDWEIETVEGSENAKLFHRLAPESARGTLKTDSLLLENPSSPVLVYFLNREIYRHDFDKLKTIRERLSDTLNDHPYVKEIDATLNNLEKIQPGNVAPDFTLETPDGDSLSLSDLRGKYVLVDFWASWCPDCRKSHPYLVDLYNRFKDENFTMLGVSVDEDRTRWLEAIEKDGLIWPQGITRGGWQSEVPQTYAIRWIPTGILIGPDGVIIARSIEHEVLGSRIRSLFD